MVASTIKPGNIVQVSFKHWLRPGHNGTIVESVAKRGSPSWKVRFAKVFPGGGYTEPGETRCQYLNLEETNFEEVIE